jgi:uncharacterized OB-fold protein
MVLLDGADTPILHAVDTTGPDAVRSGMRVRIRWAAQTVGHIRDIACFEPVDAIAPLGPEAGDQSQSQETPA